MNKYYGPEFELTLQGDEEGKNKMEQILSQIENSLKDIVETILAGDLDIPQAEKGICSILQFSSSFSPYNRRQARSYTLGSKGPTSASSVI